MLTPAGPAPPQAAAQVHPRPQEIVSLTSLRAFAAWWVVVYHLRAMAPVSAAWDNALLELGWVGVDIFFVLSGFVLSYVYAPQLKTGAFSYRAFVIRRIARIYPLHLATLAFVALLAAISLAAGLGLTVEDQLRPGEGYDPARTILAHLTMTHAWGVDPVGHFNAPSWSISAEWFAYLAFPLLAALALRRSLALALVAGLASCAAISVFTRLALSSPPAELMGEYGFLRIVPEFLFGMVVYRLHRGFCLRCGALAIAAGLALVLADHALGLGSYTVPFAAAAVVWGAAAIDAPRGVTHYLGRISYATYMVHLPVMIVTWPLINRIGGGPAVQLVLLAGVLAAVLVASMLAYHLLESPAERWIRNRAGIARAG